MGESNNPGGGSPGARATDPETSHLAADGDLDLRGCQRLAVLCHLEVCGSTGATDYETSKALGILRTSAGKRRLELCAAGLVENSGLRRLTDTTSTAIVWQATDRAVPAIEEVERRFLFHERVAIKMDSGIPQELAEQQAREELKGRKEPE